MRAARWVADYAELFAGVDDVLNRRLYDIDKQRLVLHMKCRYTEDASRRIDEVLAGYATRRSSTSPLAVKRLRWLAARMRARARARWAAWLSRRARS